MCVKLYPRYYPVMRTPWNLKFRIWVLRNNPTDVLGMDIDQYKFSYQLHRWFHHGGILLGLGAKTERGFGRFRVTEWKPDYLPRI